jgi:hypothetical protein
VDRHCCYVPLIQLEFKLVVSDAAGAVEWPLISAAHDDANCHSSNYEQQ